MLTFLALDGHSRSSKCWSPASTRCPSARPGSAARAVGAGLLGRQMFAGALAVALPGITALLIVNLAFGVMSRAAPSLNLFAVGFPVSLVFGLVVVLVGIAACRRASSAARPGLRVPARAARRLSHG